MAAMDIRRDPVILKRERNRRVVSVALGVVALAGLAILVSRLKIAAPLVPAGAPWIESVKRGQMIRNVRGSGTLVPEDTRWISSATAGRVERVLLQPGARVDPGSVILELSNPELQQASRNAELAWKSAIAQLDNQRATLLKERAAQESAVKDAELQLAVAKADYDANSRMAAQQLISQLTLDGKRSVLEQTGNRLDLARRHLHITIENEASQLAPQQAAVEQQQAQLETVRRQVADLAVKAGMSGVLQAVAVERGQQVTPGANLARVADPSALKAVIRISETQTRDLAPGQRAAIDTHNGAPLRGRVARIDPASQQGTVGVDVTLDDPLRPGDRPDVSIDGTIELQQLDDVVYMPRPAFGQPNSAITIFRLTPDGREALRTPVKLGREAVATIEVVEGLRPGDQVILSDMSQYDAYDRVRIK